jgi:hypothetical protein
MSARPTEAAMDRFAEDAFRLLATGRRVLRLLAEGRLAGLEGIEEIDHYMRLRAELGARWTGGGPTPFYDLSEQARVAVTEQAMSAKTTLVSRWSALALAEATPWGRRAAVAAEMLGPVRSVADIGCGLMTLEQHLGPDVRYIPVDVVRRDERTLVCDLNAGPLPVLGAEAAACLGIIEYLFDADALLWNLRRQCAACVVSYNPLEVDAKREPAPRRAHGWVNDFSASELEALFTAAGWAVEGVRETDGGQRLWRLTAT